MCLRVPAIYYICNTKFKQLLAFSGAFLSVLQKYLCATFNGRVLLCSCADVACGAAVFAPAMVTISSLIVLKKQAIWLVCLATKTRFH
jgi:hypothetical protein